MSPAAAILRLIRARARRRPGRAIMTLLGLAVATAFAGGVAAEGTIAADRAAHVALSLLSPLDRTVRITSANIVTPSAQRQARSLLRQFGLPAPTEVTLLNPVRLSGIVVRPAAVQPLGPWLRAPRQLGACAASSCPMLLASGAVSRTTLAAAGVRIAITGRAMLSSAAPLGFIPGRPAGQPPVLISGDVSGLESNPGLSGVFRAHSWFSLLPLQGLHAWQLGPLERRLQRAQATLLASGGGFSLTGPFDGLDAARADADAAPRRLLLAGGGALAAIVLFIVLAAGGLRRDVDAELTRLRNGGATARQCRLFVLAESALLCAAALLVGALLSLVAAALEATSAGVSVSGALTHSVLTSTGLIALVAGWACASALTTAMLLLRGRWLPDALSVAAIAALALALSRGGGSAGSDPLPVLLAPLACLAAGVLVFRAASLILRGGERLARSGPLLVRLAFIGLARAPAAPSLAIAFVAVSTGLGGFALSYRATLERSSADQAADRVPLDATVAAGQDFVTPTQVAPLARWQELAHGAAYPVRRTEASYVNGGGSVTLPALGVPSAAVGLMHGWRSSDGPAALSVLAQRLLPVGKLRNPGPLIPRGSRVLSVRAGAKGVAVSVAAVLRSSSGSVRTLQLGQAFGRQSLLKARLPRPGPWELEAFELNEPAGLAATNGHQNAENAAATTRFSGQFQIGSVRIDGRTVAIDTWHAAGAASRPRASRQTLSLSFAASGELGLIRPLQPSDVRALPVLVDPQTAAAAGRGHRLGLEIDGVAVSARVVGVLRRFPTIPASAPGFVIADERALASALDAQDPGQGLPDELWISTRHTQALREALGVGAMAQLAASFRADIEHGLLSAPTARAVLGTLVAAAIICVVLAVLGLLIALLGAARDERVERDLIAQGIGPGALRSELRLRIVLAGVLGVLAGFAIGVLLTRLAVATVRAAGTVAVPRPAIVTVAPWAELAAWALLACAALACAAWLATMQVGRRTA